ncbi:BgTH12-01124 [Blumeria graminis f. sp. triticale]|uniref:BgTH12-01124 n=1 Tax=Blumeria graminis f. sp. triticale TaxID=1689686 RepID=A0A9W4DPK4_BLUGR|nr:BgTH12-01124 [Blumeria graminis f. sp. triticale]
MEEGSQGKGEGSSEATTKWEKWQTRGRPKNKAE